MWDVCKKPDAYFCKLTEQNLTMSWECQLSNGETIFGDYDRPGYEKCWDRFKSYIDSNKLAITSIKLYMFGIPQFVFFEDPQGLDGVSIMRGVSRDQSSPDTARDYQFLTVSKLSDGCDYIEVRKFVWPIDNEIEPRSEIRNITLQNVEHLIFKHDSEKAKHPEIQKHLDRRAL